jgi:hypothetical protein
MAYEATSATAYPDGNQGEKMVPRADESAAVPPQKDEAANSRGGSRSGPAGSGG